MSQPVDISLGRVFFSTTDVGVVIEGDITFASGYDSTGAVVTLEVDPGTGPQPSRTMAFVAAGPGTPPPGGVATYSVLVGEFPAGVYNAQVKFTKGAQVVNSQPFQIVVTPGA